MENTFYCRNIIFIQKDNYYTQENLCRNSTLTQIQEKTGKCTATIQDCKYADNGVVPEHYATENEAQKAFEIAQKDNLFTQQICNKYIRKVSEYLGFKKSIRNSYSVVHS